MFQIFSAAVAVALLAFAPMATTAKGVCAADGANKSVAKDQLEVCYKQAISSGKSYGVVLSSAACGYCKSLEKDIAKGDFGDTFFVSHDRFYNNVFVDAISGKIEKLLTACNLPTGVLYPTVMVFNPNGSCVWSKIGYPGPGGGKLKEFLRRG